MHKTTLQGPLYKSAYKKAEETKNKKKTKIKEKKKLTKQATLKNVNHAMRMLEKQTRPPYEDAHKTIPQRCTQKTLHKNRKYKNAEPRNKSNSNTSNKIPTTTSTMIKTKKSNGDTSNKKPITIKTKKEKQKKKTKKKQ
ncbi:hypothetical protein C2G38_2215741 [Gigaspora rosea]|uniref:Uncharacterized protein n=1 Tax=Gigaspora rosea TaxID=44941 RepID=A0A397U9L0_9GLOM|nr:hypothetical protein C2G38_2215741 [Gigaspora rosea]